MISLAKYKGARLVDIRKYFTDKESGELKPTRKGLSLQKKNFFALLDALQESRESISSWLDRGNEEYREAAENILANRAEAQQRMSREAHDISTVSDSWRSPKFFEIESHGGKDVVVLNQEHSFASALQRLTDVAQPECGKDHPFIGIVSELLVSYGRAKLLLEEEEEVSASQLFAALEYEWGVILRNYLDSGGDSK